MATLHVVAIIDDDGAVRESTAALLRAAAYKVELFENGDAFLISNLSNISCVLLDMRMPGANGIDVLRQLGERETYPPVVVFTGHGDVALAVETMKLGAIDFLEKPYDPASLLNALSAAIDLNDRHRPAMSPSPEAKLLIDRLSGRQQEVLSGMLNGQPNKIIAWKLGLSIRTVEAHRAQVMSRLQVRSIADAIQTALAAGMRRDRPNQSTP